MNHRLLTEDFNVSDSQSITFSGTILSSGGTQTLSGTASQIDRVAVVWGLDYLVGTNHKTQTSQDTFWSGALEVSCPIA